jgi:hypothetical protein
MWLLLLETRCVSSLYNNTHSDHTALLYLLVLISTSMASFPMSMTSWCSVGDGTLTFFLRFLINKQNYYTRTNKHWLRSQLDRLTYISLTHQQKRLISSYQSITSEKFLHQIQKVQCSKTCNPVISRSFYAV